MPLHVLSTMCSSSGGQNCIIQHLVSSHSVGVMIPDYTGQVSCLPPPPLFCSCYVWHSRYLLWIVKDTKCAIVMNIVSKLCSSISRKPDEIVTTWRRSVLELDMPFAMCHYPEPRF